ncbi:MAG: FAD binding domain-containing protein [bacterium]
MLQEFIRPRTVAEAVKAHDKHPDYFYIAGGSEILARDYPATPEKISGLIDLSGLGLNRIVFEEKSLRIDPAVTLQELADSPETEKPPFAILREAALNVSNRNVRNRATVGGNIAACKSCSDLIPPLLVLDAELDVAITFSKRAPVPILEYVIRDEKGLITAIRVPEKENFFMGIRRYTRTANDLALVNVCLGLKLQAGKIKDARLAIGGVAATVMRIPEAEQFLIGRELTGRLPELAPTLRSCVEKSVHPVDDHRGKAWFKRELAGGLAVEALYVASRKGGVL